jgi:hypothetical protein
MNKTELNSKSDICKIDKLISKIKGIDSNSASPTDIWFLTFKDNVFYDKEPLLGAVLKIFINLSSFKEPKEYKFYSELEGLNYELQVYKNIIQPIIEYKICPNFIKYLGSGIKCSYDNLYRMLDKHIYEDKDKTYSDDITKKLLNRNINCIKSSCSNRKSIDKKINRGFFNLFGFLDNTSQPDKSIKYNFIMIQKLSLTTVSIDDFLVKEKEDISCENILLILFQIAFACYTMSLCKLIHNDLHSGNIMLEELKKEEIFTYIINDKKYTFSTKYNIYVYDFDRAYCPRFGKNILLEDHDSCENNGQCNTFIENKDFLKIFCYFTWNFYYKKNKSHFKNIIKFILKDIQDLDKLLEIYSNDCFIGPEHDNFFVEKCHKMEDIVFNFGKRIHKKDLQSNKKNIFVCHKNFFNKDGSINSTKIKI